VKLSGSGATVLFFVTTESGRRYGPEDVALAEEITLFEQDAESSYRWIYNPPAGFQPADVLGKNNDELFRPEEATRVNALDRAVLRAGERIQEEIRITPRAAAPATSWSRRSRCETPRARSSASPAPPRTSPTRTGRRRSCPRRSRSASRCWASSATT
jgi:hypothetical protein